MAENATKRERPDADRGQLRLAAQAPARAGAAELRRGPGSGRRRVRRADGVGSTSRTSRSRSSRPTCRTRSPPTGCWPRRSPTRSTWESQRRARSGRARSSPPSASARCWPTGWGTRSESASPPSTPRRRSRSAWEILKALQLRERGPVLIACPTCGRLQFDMDTVVAEIEERLEAYDRAGRGRRPRLRRQRDRRGLSRGLRDHRRQGRGPDLLPRQAAAEGEAGRAGRRPVRRDRQVARPRRGAGRGGQGPRGRGLARADRGGERRRAHPRAHRPDGGRGLPSGWTDSGPGLPYGEPFQARQARQRWTRKRRPWPDDASPAPSYPRA